VPSVPKKDDAPKAPVYRFRLKDDVEGGVASVMVGERAVDLGPDNAEVETNERAVAVSLRDVPWLEEIS
jgi:hypothetical protein